MQKEKRTSYIAGLSLYPLEFVGHHVQGILVAAGILLGNTSVIVCASLWVFIYCAYQGFTVIRKKDAAGLDVADLMVGFGIGIAFVGTAILAGAI